MNYTHVENETALDKVVKPHGLALGPIKLAEKSPLPLMICPTNTDRLPNEQGVDRRTEVVPECCERRL